jgi:hypothetical protein
MGMRATSQQINSAVRKVQKQYGPLRHRVIYASNGETAILWYDASTNDWVLNPAIAGANAKRGGNDTPYGEQSYQA